MSNDFNPLVDPSPEEVPLKNAPLERVLVQVRFPLIASLNNVGFIGPFQEAIRDAYPVLRPEQARGIAIGPQGASATSSPVTWRFNEVEGAWRVSLAPTFVALETSSYTSRTDFLDRLRVVLDALIEHVGPQRFDRLGVRYIDRVTGESLEDIGQLVRPEVLGVVSTPMAEHAVHSLCETLFTVEAEEAKLFARWGTIPAQTLVDPALEPLGERSWILDLDMFSEGERDLDRDELLESTRAYAERTYSFFRWAVTKVFLKRFGGEP